MSLLRRFHLRPGFLQPAGRSATRGLTLIELMIVVAIIVTLVSIGLTKYRFALDTAKSVKAKQTLMTLAFEIDSYKVRNGQLPKTLFDVGFGDRLDPWGFPYIYLNFGAGTGSGVQYAAAGGLIDPASFAKSKKPPADETADADEVQELKRKDQFLFPLNTDYDLFSLGPNGKALGSLTEQFSLDDILRANDGDYYGRASDY